MQRTREKVRLRGALILVALLAAPVVAAAPDLWQRSQPYLAIAMGAGYAPNASLDGRPGRVDFDLGRPIGSLMVGIDPDGGWRYELDASYRYNDAEVIVLGDGRPDVDPENDSRMVAKSLGASVIYDFDTGRGFRPYLGAGLARARIDYRLSQELTAVELLDDTDTTTAYQLIAGFALPLTAHLDLQLDYRFWRAGEIRLHDVDSVQVDTEYTVHSAMLNLRYKPAGAARLGPATPLRRHGWYVQTAAGPARTRDAEIKNNIANFDAFDMGAAATLAAGYAFTGPWRLELEAAARRAAVEIVDFNPEFGEARTDGRVHTHSLMANAAYEPRWGHGYQPYAALGAGVAWSDWEVSLVRDGSVYVDDSASAPAFQVVIGAAAPVTDRLQVAAEYRYWMTGLFDLVQPDGRPMRTGLTVHSLMLGLRYVFAR